MSSDFIPKLKIHKKLVITLAVLMVVTIGVLDRITLVVSSIL